MPSQSPSWLDAMSASVASHDASRLYRFDDGVEAVLPAVWRGGPVRPLAQLASMPAAWGFGGLVSSARIGPEHVRAVLDDLARSGFAQVHVRPNPIHADVWKDAAPPDAIRLPGLAHVLDLRPGYDELHRGFANDVRRLAGRARRSGVTIRRGHELCDVKTLMQLLRVSVRRWAARDGEPLVLAQARLRVRDPERKLSRIVTALAPRAEIFSAWRAEQPIAAALVLFGRNAHYVRGATDVEAGNVGASQFLQTEAIAAACAAGCLRYHLGESAAGSGLARFKGRFGAEAVPYVRYRFERAPLTALDQKLRRTVRSILGVHGG